MDWLGDILFGWFFDVLYILQKSICVVIDFIVDTFNKLSGLETVTVGGKQTDLLSHFVQSDAVRTAFMGVFLVGVILLCVFVLIAIIRSEYADQQHKRTKAQILVKAGQSFIIFLIIPLLLAAGILLTNAVMGAVNGSMLATVSGGGRTLFGGQILVTSGQDAYIGRAGMRAEVERQFLTGELDYNNLSVVKQYYDLWNVNFLVGILSGLVLLVLFALAAIRFVQRLFDIILLYIISPVSVATIPADDGARFKIWREMAVSKILSAYGIVLAMNLFFLIIPQVNQIRFFESDSQNGLIGLLFVVGGAFAVTKAYMVIAQLTGSNAGAQEAQQTMAGIYSGIRMVRGTVRFAAGAVGQVIGGSDFRNNSRHGMGFGANINASIHSTRNQRVVNHTDGHDGGKDGKGNKDKPDCVPKQDGFGGNTSSVPVGDSDNTTATDGKYNAQVAGVGQGNTAADGKNNEQTSGAGQGNTAADGKNNEQTAATDKGQERTAGQTAAHVAGGVGRLATLPAGVLKDTLQGGLITAGKNIWPRIRNVANGRGIINHADVKPKQTDKPKSSGGKK